MIKIIRNFIILAFILFLTVLAYADEKKYESPMSLYQDNFFIAGNEKDQVKIQVSAKYNLLWPSQTGLYAGYTQLSNWICYKQRDTFYTMYAPEVFYCFESGNNLFNNYTIPFIDYIQISPITHNSTGVEGLNHRGINIYYGQVQFSYGDVCNIGVNIKGFNYYSVSNYNKDIADYKGYYEADIFFKIRSKTVSLMDKEELHFKFGANPLNTGWFGVEARFRIITSYIQPKIFVAWYKGYDEFMVNYNKKTNSVRVGVVF